LFRHV